MHNLSVNVLISIHVLIYTKRKRMHRPLKKLGIKLGRTRLNEVSIFSREEKESEKWREGSEGALARKLINGTKEKKGDHPSPHCQHANLLRWEFHGFFTAVAIVSLI